MTESIYNEEFNIEDKWEKMKASYRDLYPSLTEEDTTFRTGEFDDMTHRIARRTNRSRDQVMAEIREWNL